MLRKRINEMRHFLQMQTSRITEYDEQLVRRLIEKITVYDDKLIFEFTPCSNAGCFPVHRKFTGQNRAGIEFINQMVYNIVSEVCFRHGG